MMMMLMMIRARRRLYIDIVFNSSDASSKLHFYCLKLRYV